MKIEFVLLVFVQNRINLIYTQFNSDWFYNAYISAANTVNLSGVSCNTNRMAQNGRKEGNVSFNDALNTFYLRLYGVRHMVKDSDKETRCRHGLLFLISSKGSFICIIPQTG